MSDRRRSPEEIEGTISRMQDELSEDLGELEYRFSRRGVEDRARERVSSGAHAVVERAADIRGRATDTARRLSDQAGRRASSLGRSFADGLERNRPLVAVAAGMLALGLGIYLAQARNRAGRP
jgi:hypothetical protein